MLAALVVPCSAQAQSTMMMSSSMYGAGPRGYDWQIGTWSCTNSMPSKMGGPSAQRLVVTRGSVGGTLFYRVTAMNFDVSSYGVYMPKTKTWLSPFIVGDGSYGSEWTTQAGRKIIWTGSVVYSGTGKTMQIRDTYIMSSSTKYSDLGEAQMGGAWKAQYNITCMKL